eukprot:6276971-Alexandrium_andersonii.AAC.1
MTRPSRPRPPCAWLKAGEGPGTLRVSFPARPLLLIRSAALCPRAARGRSIRQACPEALPAPG